METIVKNDNYHFKLEETGIGVFMHCEVFKWNKTIYRELFELYLDAMDLFGEHQVLVFVEKGNSKLGKFCNLFNMYPFKTTLDPNGDETGDLYRWEQ